MAPHGLIKELIESALSRLFAEVSDEVLVSPQVDLLRGDYWTGACFEVAQTRRLPPSEIAEQVVELVSSDTRFSFCPERGYINVFVREPTLWRNSEQALESDYSHPHKVEQRVCIIPGVESSRGTSRLDSLRLVARALVQTHLLAFYGQPVRLYIFDRGDLRLSESHRDFSSILLGALEAPALDASRLCDMVESRLFEGLVGPVHLWVPPFLMENRSFVSHVTRWPRDRGAGLRVRSVERARTFLGQYDQDRCSKMNRSELWRLCLNLCSPVDISGIDLESACLPERANLQWYIGQTCARLKRLPLEELLARWVGARLAIHNEKVSPASLPHIVTQRLNCWHLFVREAADRGKLEELWQAMRSLLDAVNTILNDPVSYYTGSKGGCAVPPDDGGSVWDIMRQKITFGVHDCFSSMLEITRGPTG